MSAPSTPTPLLPYHRARCRREKTGFRKARHSAYRPPFKRRTRLAANRRVALLGPFGEPLLTPTGVAAEMPFRFSTHYTDAETGLLCAKLRYYQPSIGRWLSRDPIGEHGGENLYGYVVNSPLALIDPFGEDFIVVGDRPLEGTPGIAVGLTNVSGLRHMSLEFYKQDRPLTREGDRFTPNTIPSGAKRVDAVELQRDTSKYGHSNFGWKRGRISTWAHIGGSIDFEHISMIQMSSTADRKYVIYADSGFNCAHVTLAAPGSGESTGDEWAARLRRGQVSHDPSGTEDTNEKWNKIIGAAWTYPYAEFPYSTTLQKWPNSQYQATSNNSNTFVREMARVIGRNADAIGGSHRGNQFPSQVIEPRPTPTWLSSGAP